jgi:predicted ABC-type ATPase
MILNYQEFLLTETSKNDPIPLITREKKGLFIVMLGSPASGKSTFTHNFILPRNPTFKVINPDDISLTRSGGDPTKYIHGTSALSIKYLLNVAQGKHNLLYDSTGTDFERIAILTSKLRALGYKIVFIHFLVPLKTSLELNIHRKSTEGRFVQEPYVKASHEKSLEMIKKIYYSQLYPDNYYLIYNKLDYMMLYEYMPHIHKFKYSRNITL